MSWVGICVIYDIEAGGPNYRSRQTYVSSHPNWLEQGFK